LRIDAADAEARAPVILWRRPTRAVLPPRAHRAAGRPEACRSIGPSSPERWLARRCADASAPASHERRARVRLLHPRHHYSGAATRGIGFRWTQTDRPSPTGQAGAWTRPRPRRRAPVTRYIS